MPVLFPTFNFLAAELGDSIGRTLQKILTTLREVKAPVSGTSLASAARTTSTVTADIDTTGYKGIIAYLNVTAVPGVGGIRMKLILKDPVSGQIKGQFQGTTNITTTGLHTMVVYPGCGQTSGATSSGTSNVVLGMPVGELIQIQVEHTTVDSYTYSLATELLP